MRQPALLSLWAGALVLAGCAHPGPLAQPGAPALLGLRTASVLAAFDAASPIAGPGTGPALATAGGPTSIAAAGPAPLAVDEDDDDGHGLVRRLVFYIPNRVFDLLDMVRARLRLAGGFGVQARFTRPLSAYAASYAGIFVGLHGPRGEIAIPWPAGFEALSGVGVSVVDLGTDGPYYGIAEIGAGVQILILGVDLGIEPWELVDFVAGLVTVDLVGDDF